MWHRLGIKSLHLEQSHLSTFVQGGWMALIDQDLVADVAPSIERPA